MNKHQAKQRIKFLKELKKSKNKDDHLQKCSDESIEFICEACHNILQVNIRNKI